MMFNVCHKRSCVVDQISIDKKNVPPPLVPITIQERGVRWDRLLHALKAIGQMNNLKMPWM